MVEGEACRRCRGVGRYLCAVLHIEVKCLECGDKEGTENEEDSKEIYKEGREEGSSR